ETRAIPMSEQAGAMGMLEFTKDDIMHWIELGVMSLLAILVLLLGVRPIIRRILGPEASAGATGVRTIVGPTGAVVATVGPSGVLVPATPGGVNITGASAGS